jgi:hypothetical protein
MTYLTHLDSRILAPGGIQEIHGKLDYRPSAKLLRTCLRGNDARETPL